MIALYLAACTDETEHEIGHRLAEFAAKDAFGIICTLTHKNGGKPIFAASPLHPVVPHVSISHSKGLCLAAVSDREIGADIERMDPRGDSLIRLAARYFTSDELAYVKESPLPRFYEIWTAKESFIKYTGEGFSRTLPSFSVLSMQMPRFTRFVCGAHMIAVCSEESAEAEPTFIQL